MECDDAFGVHHVIENVLEFLLERACPAKLGRSNNQQGYLRELSERLGGAGISPVPPSFTSPLHNTRYHAAALHMQMAAEPMYQIVFALPPTNRSRLNVKLGRRGTDVAKRKCFWSGPAAENSNHGETRLATAVPSLLTAT